MKILLACSQYPPMKTGFARTAGGLSAWFTRLGHQVEILTEGMGCYRIGKIAFLNKAGKAKFKEAPDIVQIIGPTPFFSEQCVKNAKKNKLPVVYHVSAFPGLSSYYHNPVGGLIDSVYKRMNLQRSIGNSDLVISNTHDFAESCLAFYNGPIEVIPDGIELDGLDVHSEPCEVDRNRALFVGQLRRYKGLPYLIKAVKQLRDDGKVVQLDIVGGGPDLERIQSLVAKANLQESVFLNGELSDKELNAIYARSRVLVLPSVQSESFGIVLLEAAAHGVPVIATDLPGVREVVKFLGGTIVPPKDSDELAKAIERVLEEPSSRRGKTISLDRFAWKNIARRYLDCYRKVAGLEPEVEFPLSEEIRTLQAAQ